MRVIAGLVVVLVASLMSVDARADEETQAPSLAASGLIMFVGSYAASAAMALSYRDTDERVATKMLVPVVGPWITLKDDRFDGTTSLTGRMVKATRADHCSGDAAICPAELLFAPVAIVEYAFLLIDPIAQATGVVMAFAGAAKSDPEKPHERPSEPEPPKVSVRPALVGTGPGISLSVTRW